MFNQPALKELKSILLDKYPAYIDRLILFGSRINESAREYSDYDLLLILKKSYDWRFENEIYDICSEVNLKYDIITDIKIISEQELKTIRGKQPFIQDAISYGITI